MKMMTPLSLSRGEMLLANRLLLTDSITDSPPKNGGTSSRCPSGGGQLGSTSVVTDASGATVGQHDLNSQSNTFSLGLMDYNARFYSQTLGRFIQADSVTPGGPQGLNRYAYVDNNPISRNDPNGFYVRLFPPNLPACH